MMRAEDAPPNPKSSSSSSSDDPPMELKNPSSSFRSLSDLPQHLLISILERIAFSISDLLSLSAVCRHFRSTAASFSFSGGPPLLLNPTLYFQTLIPGNTKRYRSPISSQTLAADRYLCVGYTNPHLIFIVGDSFALLVDVFTGREIRSPNFPLGSFDFSLGILTAPPLMSSSGLVLLVVRNQDSREYSILCWRPGSSGSKWSVLKLEECWKILSLVSFKGRIFGLDAHHNLIAVEFVPRMSWMQLEVELPAEPLYGYHYGKFGYNMVECDRELLMVFLAPKYGPNCIVNIPKMVVYKLDLEKSAWVEKESLGDWCLFVDGVGKCGFACKDPSRWGGRKNCVYYAGPGVDGWSVYPLDGDAIDTDDGGSPLCWWHKNLPKWPSPIWVYPSMLL